VSARIASTAGRSPPDVFPLPRVEFPPLRLELRLLRLEFPPLRLRERCWFFDG
jgi:hypothetical protein